MIVGCGSASLSNWLFSLYLSAILFKRNDLGKRLSRSTTISQPARADTPKGGVRRAQILEAAAECFRREGFHGTSMARIAAAAGMSTGHVFHYFKRKEEIVEAIVARERTVLEAFAERLRDADSKADVVTVMLEGVEEALIRRTGDGTTSLTMEVMAEATRNPEIAAMLQAFDQQARQVIESRLGSDSPEAASRGEILSALFDGLAIRALRNPDLARTLDRGMLRAVITSVLTG